MAVVSVLYYAFYNFYFAPRRDVKYCIDRVCMSVGRFLGLSVCWHASKTTRPNFTKFSVHFSYLWPWLGPHLTTLQYLVYFRFCG